MKIKHSKDKKSLIITEIYNESMLDDVQSYSSRSGCEYTTEDCCTKAIVTGTIDQLNLFIKFWNGEESPWDKKYDPKVSINNQLTTKKSKTMATAKKADSKKTASKSKTSTKAVEKASRVQDPALNKTQQKIFDNEELPKSEKFRRLFKHGCSKSHIARLFNSPYSFVRAAIERQEGLEAEVAAKHSKAEA